MKFGLSLPNFGRLGTREAVVEIAQEAEALGFDSVWTTDHVIMRQGQEEPYGHILEALTTLTYVAALTSRVRLGVSVLVFPQRSPVVVAKETATLDYLSGGRLILGVGAGWNEAEFGFIGADFKTRGRRLDEYIGVLRELWTSPEPRFDGQFVHFSNALFSPRSVQPSGPPIWIGGGSPAALRRAARLADGWHAVGATPEVFTDGMRQIAELADGRPVEGSVRLRMALDRELPQARGADGRPQATLSGSKDAVVARIGEYQRAGADHLVIQPMLDDLGAYLEELRRFAAEVRPVC